MLLILFSGNGKPQTSTIINIHYIKKKGFVKAHNNVFTLFNITTNFVSY